MPYRKCTLPEYPCTTDMWDELKNETRPIIIYGMGNGADKLLDHFAEYGITASDIFASDGFVRGHCFRGMRVKSFSEIKENYSDFVIVLSFATSRVEVLDMLERINEEYDMYVPDMPVADVREYFDKDFFNSHYNEICEAYSILSDEASRNCYAAIVNYKLSGRMSYLLSAYSEKEELYSLFSRNFETIVDAGAYNGDTLIEAKKYFPNLKKAYAIEPDKRNFKKLQRYCEAENDFDIEIFNAAAWNKDELGSFQGSGNRNSSISSTGSYEHRCEDVELVSIDSIVKCSVDYIKYDVEGAEYEALVGSQKTINNDKPSLLVSLYHRSRDIFYLVNYISKKHPHYDFYLRRLKCLPAWELDLILIPKNMEKNNDKKTRTTVSRW